VNVLGLLRRLVMGIAWVAIAAAIAFGSAGLIAALNPPPIAAGRLELTYETDAQLAPALDAATEQLRILSSQVDALSGTTRDALTQLAAEDRQALDDSIAQGTLDLADVQATANTLRQALTGLPHTGDDWPLYVSTDLRRRYVQLAGTAGLTAGLEDEWARFTGRALAASRVVTLLTRHDEETAAAARSGADAKYREALDGLAKSDATIAEARELRDQLAPTTDVVTLTSWLDRNADYDAALRHLYETLIDSNGEVTNAVRRAFDREQAARSALPADTRGLIVILSDVAQGGLNDAVISIEEARGAIAEALEAQEQLRDGPEPGTEPAPTPPG
jgi:hypothetical protein